MDASTRQLVRQRAGGRCEYCRIPQRAAPFIAFHIEHICAQQHGGDDRPENLALACDRCNAYKGPNLVSIDPETGETAGLFHPRHHDWAEHFVFDGGRIVGLTAIGRASVRLLKMNAPRRVQLRQAWVDAGESLG